MGDQSQVQAPTQSDTQTLTQPHHDTAVASTTTTTTTTITSQSTETTTNVPLENPSPTTKISCRPPKIRKLSPDPSHTKSPKIESAETPKFSITPAAKSPNSKISPSLQLKIIPTITSRPLSCEGEIETALGHLRAADPLLAPLIDLYNPPTFDSFHTPFHALTKSILFQQLACKAGTSIYTRFVSLCGGEAGVLPDTVIALSPQQLRQIGVSSRKASYLHDLSRKYQNGILSDSSILEMDDESLLTMLTMVNGIGPWSVHMFMIFSLHRPDVLPANDLGVRKGVQILHGLKELPRPSQMEHLCEKWKPYRSVAAWYMWRLVESKGAPPSGAVVVEAGSASLQQPQEQQQQHFLDPISGVLNIGACAWGQ